MDAEPSVKHKSTPHNMPVCEHDKKNVFSCLMKQLGPRILALGGYYIHKTRYSKLDCPQKVRQIFLLKGLVVCELQAASPSALP